MKKLVVLMLVAIMAFGATSCKKEVVYKPKKQISKITEIKKDNNGAEVISPYEEWNWDGKQLESITLYWLTNAKKEPMVEHFKYDGNRIVSSECKPMGHTSEYFYDGKYLSSIKTEVESPLFEEYTSTFEFEHDGKKISRITHTIHGIMKDPTVTTSPLRYFMPENISENIIEFEKQNAIQTRSTEDTKVAIYTLEWDGDNVVSMESKTRNAGSNDTISETYTFTYDDKPNVYRGLYAFCELFYAGGYGLYNKNNLLSYKVQNTTENTYSKTDYEYTYDEDGYVSSYISKREYEYSWGHNKYERKYEIQYVEK